MGGRVNQNIAGIGPCGRCLGNGAASCLERLREFGGLHCCAFFVRRLFLKFWRHLYLRRWTARTSGSRPIEFLEVWSKVSYSAIVPVMISKSRESLLVIPHSNCDCSRSRTIENCMRTYVFLSEIFGVVYFYVNMTCIFKIFWDADGFFVSMSGHGDSRSVHFHF